MSIDNFAGISPRVNPETIQQVQEQGGKLTDIMLLSDKYLNELISELKNPPADKAKFIEMYEEAMTLYEDVAKCIFTGRAEYLRLIRENYGKYIIAIFDIFNKAITALNVNQSNSSELATLASNNEPASLLAVINGNANYLFNIYTVGGEITVENIEKGHLSKVIRITGDAASKDQLIFLHESINKHYEGFRNKAVDFANRINDVAPWKEGEESFLIRW